MGDSKMHEANVSSVGESLKFPLSLYNCTLFITSVCVKTVFYNFLATPLEVQISMTIIRQNPQQKGDMLCLFAVLQT